MLAIAYALIARTNPCQTAVIQVCYTVSIVAIISLVQCHCMNDSQAQASLGNRLVENVHKIQPVVNNCDQSLAIDEGCPPWFIHDNASGCICGESQFGIAECCSETRNILCYPNTSVKTYPSFCIQLDFSRNV